MADRTDEVYEAARTNPALARLVDEVASELYRCEGWSEGGRERCAIRDAFEEQLEDALALGEPAAERTGGPAVTPRAFEAVRPLAVSSAGSPSGWESGCAASS